MERKLKIETRWALSARVSKMYSRSSTIKRKKKLLRKMHDSAIEYSFAQVLIKKYTGGKYFIVIISSINAYVLF